MMLIVIAAILAILTAAGMGLLFWRLTQILCILRFWRISWSDGRRVMTERELPRPPDGADPQAPADEGRSPMVRRAENKLKQARSEGGYEI